jgi:hypothetical protein
MFGRKPVPLEVELHGTARLVKPHGFNAYNLTFDGGDLIGYTFHGQRSFVNVGNLSRTDFNNIFNLLLLLLEQADVSSSPESIPLLQNLVSLFDAMVKKMQKLAREAGNQGDLDMLKLKEEKIGKMKNKWFE